MSHVGKFNYKEKNIYLEGKKFVKHRYSLGKHIKETKNIVFWLKETSVNFRENNDHHILMIRQFEFRIIMIDCDQN